MKASAALMAIGLLQPAFAWEPALPPRPADAPAGREFAAAVAHMDMAAREAAIVREVLRGNVPEWWRKFADVPAGPAVIQVAPDYLAVGSEEDFVRWPLSPAAAQRIADAIGCMLPTAKIVDLIHAAAPLKLAPQPRPPGPLMTTVTELVAHNEQVAVDRARALDRHPWGTLTAGPKKDIVLTPRLAGRPDRVAIYGWHRPAGTPIQPLFLGHAGTWADYSHGVRLVARHCKLNGEPREVGDLLADDRWCVRLSSEGPFRGTDYSTIRAVAPDYAGEKTEVLFLPGGVRAFVNRSEARRPGETTRLVIYAVPAGNTLEQTSGRRMRSKDDDWHFDIQHIAAQVRWLRKQGEDNLVLACVESPHGSWAAWRKQTAEPGRILAEIYRSLQKAEPDAKLVLAGHSAGGSFIFGLIEQWDRIPDEVERIAWLDANYAYDRASGHDRKLLEWLDGAENRRLYVSAYEDHRALLDGKHFVSEAGGTWGRSQAMRADLDGTLRFSHRTHGDLEQHVSHNGRAIFRLRRNPEGKVWHTRLVELNGFIDALLAGGPREGGDYQFLGPRVYEGQIAP